MNKFSIICPFYNSEEFLEETINSVLNQSFSNWELIMVNDCSTDNGRAICENYSIKDKRIKLFDNKKNEGPYNSRLKGVNLSTGNYILFLDSDDLLSFDALDELSSIISKENPNVVLFEYTRDTKQLGINSPNKIVDDCIITNSLILRYLFVDNVSLNLWTKCYKRSLFDKTYEKCAMRYSEDSLFLFNTVLSAEKMIVTNKMLIFYRENNKSITHHLTYQEVEDAWITYNIIFSRLFELKVFDGIFLSEKVVENICWALFMVVWLSDSSEYPNAYINIRDTFVYKCIENVKIPRINFTVNHVLKYFISKKDKKVNLFKRLYKFIKGGRNK